jgi:hypothetical protein
MSSTFVHPHMLKNLLLEEKAEILESSDQDRYLDEFIDSQLPIYYSDIIAEWSEMPSEFQDSHLEFGLPSVAEYNLVTSLMTQDLYNYYSTTTRQMWAEIIEESESE